MTYCIIEKLTCKDISAEQLRITEAGTMLDAVRTWCDTHMAESEADQAVERYRYDGVMPGFKTVSGAELRITAIYPVSEKQYEVLNEFITRL